MATLPDRTDANGRAIIHKRPFALHFAVSSEAAFLDQVESVDDDRKTGQDSGKTTQPSGAFRKLQVTGKDDPAFCQRNDKNTCAQNFRRDGQQS